MEELQENHYIEHWEKGIGKIVRADDKSVTVAFFKQGNIEVPREKTTYYDPI